MAGEIQSGMACSEFESLLSDALDQTLNGATLQRFQAHGGSCAVCGPLLREAEMGRGWLKALDEAEPPSDLVNNILAATSGVRSNRRVSAGWWEQLSAAIVAPITGVLRQPRFVMSFGMAFFAVSICLSLAGVRLSDLSTADLRPSAIKRNYYETSGRVVKYYENIRVVYEMESRAQEFKRVIAPAAPTHEQDKNQEHRNDTSGQPQQREDRYFSQDGSDHLLAELRVPIVEAGKRSRRAL